MNRPSSRPLRPSAAVGVGYWVALILVFPIGLTAFAARGQGEVVSEGTPPATPDANANTSAPRDRVVEYRPGLRIDWPKRRIEVDGKIVLREGMLELLACTRNTREHESIIVVRPRPLHIHEALCLLGLEPGHPVRWDEPNQRWLPPTGPRVGVEVRWQAEGTTHTVDAGEWLQEVATGMSLPRQEWVFAGSFKTEAGTFTADEDGTIFCVVDFPSALLTLPDQHSADNADLTLQAYTQRIPPRDTPVTLVVTPLDPVEFDVTVGPDETARIGTELVDLERLKTRMQEACKRHERIRVVLRVKNGTGAAWRGRVETAVRAAVGERDIRVVDESPGQGVDRPPADRDSTPP